jgi:hypothetical protein
MKFWAGFVEGKIHVRTVDSGFGGWGNSFTEQPALFKTKDEARKEYEDVRHVEIKFL